MPAAALPPSSMKHEPPATYQPALQRIGRQHVHMQVIDGVIHGHVHCHRGGPGRHVLDELGARQEGLMVRPAHGCVVKKDSRLNGE
eukprot:1159782-Pelagomonas_calceolata.AAC.2